MKKILPKQRNDGKAFTIISLILLLLLSTSFTGSSSSGLWLARVFLLATIVLLLCFARYFHKKYQRLGNTPLYLITEHPRIGQRLKGKVLIPKPHFTKVNQLALINLFYDGRTKRTPWKILNKISTDCRVSHQDENTWLNFEFIVPEGTKASENMGDKHIYWEIEMAFTENFSLVKRNWRIHITK